MTSDQDKPGATPASARKSPFRRNRWVTPLAPEGARRQGAISALAFRLLGGRDPALDFLNTEDAALGGRPLAVATQSEAGYANIEREIHARSVFPGATHGG
ncbi:hypothetical protein V6U71_06980 [Sphingopyxis sp. J-6]|uniref:hypothetical protein n=1 Tax=Sphingopyxis sp. J-6 TaxID=3122054 RepID=UPI003983E992